MKKRFIPLLLCAMLVLAMLPVTGMGADTPADGGVSRVSDDSDMPTTGGTETETAGDDLWPGTVTLDCCTVHVTADPGTGGYLLAVSYTPEGRMLKSVQTKTDAERTEYDLSFDDLYGAGSVRLFFLDEETFMPLGACRVFTELPNETHSFTETVIREADCQEEGVTEYACTRCGYAYTEPVPKTEHTEVFDMAVEATCTETGLTEGSHCSVCGTVIKERQTVPLKEHEWTAATCTEPQTCKVCGKTEGSALGHNYVNVICTRCGRVDPGIVKSITLNKSLLSLKTGFSDTLTATVAPAAASGLVVWDSSDSNVASVSDGTVRAVGAGTAVITASAGDKSASCTVTVTKVGRGEAAFQTLADYAKNNADEVKEGKYTVKKYDALFEYEMVLSYDSQTDCLYISGAGRDSGLNAACMIRIDRTLKTPYKCTFTSNDTSANYIGYANLYPEKLDTDRSLSFISWSGSSFKKADAERFSASMLCIALLNYESYALSDTDYSMADLGFTDLFAESSEGSKVGGIKLNRTSMSLTSGTGGTLTCAVTPSSASGAVVWTSSDTEVATVSDGTVKAIGAGTAVITASAGGKSASCTVTVTAVTGDLGEAAFRILADYAKNNADEVREGIYSHAADSSGEYACSLVYDSGRDELYFSCRSVGKNIVSTIVISKTLKKPYSALYSSTITVNQAGYARVYPNQVKPGVNLAFSSWSGTSSTRSRAEKLFSEHIRTALMCYENEVLSGTGCSMTDLGFTGLFE